MEAMKWQYLKTTVAPRAGAWIRILSIIFIIEWLFRLGIYIVKYWEIEYEIFVEIFVFYKHWLIICFLFGAL